jgi:hypothetical protein
MFDLFDLTKEAETERHQRAFDEGVKEGENGSFWSDLFHDLGETATIIVPKPTEHQSREAGYWEGQRRRTR